MARLFLGCIADDFTGATDLANNLVRSGMRTIQSIGIPTSPIDSQTDAIVIALKSRTIPAQEAIDQSLAALHWLRAQGAPQIYFKYCSTFDSTAAGNIGPVIQALMRALDTDFTIATPAFPENRRSVFQGHLFVGDRLLSESGMQNHPLTPMTDSDLVRVLQSQCTDPVGLINYACVSQGSNAIDAQIQVLRSASTRIAIVDAISNQDLMEIGRAVRSLPLVTGGSGIALGLPQNFALPAAHNAQTLPPAQGSRAIIAGSCSQATQQQVAHFLATGKPSLRLDPLNLVQDRTEISRAIDWSNAHAGQDPILIYSTATPDQVKSAQAQIGIVEAGHLIEQALGAIAQGLIAQGIRQLVIAGGETSGACVQALGITRLRIGPQIDPGVPWCFASASDGLRADLHIALKSGNFGAPDFFTKSFKALQ
jgi:uncharacterized protein YgbK (DUF1537 family)